MPIDFIGFAFAITIAAGGIMGYAKAGSIPSLGSGILFGLLLSYGAYQASKSPPKYGVQLLTIAALAGIMGFRFYQTGKIIPAGLICIMATVLLLRYIFKSLLGFFKRSQESVDDNSIPAT
ncbi:transmembrane protein 14 homolog [Chrysoperla carnea]|uniref:transmembrane protein 14 homolog n=1 Tax=Chrysoperla carnea TaxID=189513 RepID=UPI001D064B87|nr:transmembrane protein 14 homolog [Chrysoperla carnea]